MSNYTFASMPSVAISRSKFHRTQPHGTSFNLGELHILGIDEVIPGSTHKIELGSLVRMSTPIAPIMDDIQYEVFSFFCPCRLTWSHWKNFMGESESAGVPQTTYTVPMVQTSGSLINSMADDLGIPPCIYGAVSGSPGLYVAEEQSQYVSVLPFRAVGLIYNRFFRNQNVEAPILIDTGDNGIVLQGSIPGTNTYDQDFCGFAPSSYSGTEPVAPRLKAYKLPDYITSSLPYALKGDPIKIPGTDGLVPVITGLENSGLTFPNTPIKYTYAYDGSTPASNKNLAITSTGGLATSSASLGTVDSATLFPTNLWADRTVLLANTIDNLRFAFQLNKALYKDALYGSRYWEVLRAHYSVTAPDSTLQDPELLGHIKFDINVSQVLQTTGFTDPSNTNLGTPGANSVTANRSHLFTASFVEHGYIIHVGVARQKRHTYSKQLNRLWSRSTRWDFYHPVFANLSAQKVLLKEVKVPSLSEVVNDDRDGNEIFGYQEAWAEYRFLPGYNSGLLNPYRPGALDYWTLADDYTTAPTLSKSFLLESRDNLKRCLVTGDTGPDFIGSYYIKDTVVNPMPLYSIPGFADHH